MHDSLRLLLGCVIACVAAGCGGNSVTTTAGPTPVKCATNLSGLPASVPAGGTRLQATVSAARECSWSATTEATWVALSPETGQGEARVTVAVAANDTPVARSGAIVVNGTRVTVNQEAASCRFDLNRSSAQIASEGGRVQVSITAMAGCAWNVSSPVPWVNPSMATGSGSRTVELIVEPNASGGARSATIQVAGRGFTVDQSGTATPGAPPAPAPSPTPTPAPNPPPAPVPPAPSCTYDVSDDRQQFDREADTGRFDVKTQPGCSWTASTTDTWIRITESSGTGAGDVRFSVESNNGPARVGAIVVGGETVRVEQEGQQPERVTLDGPVSNLRGSCPSLTFSVDGETVFTDGNTRFRGRHGCAGLADGTRVKVEGDRTAAGLVHATRVEPR